jgi:uncharacterized protein YegL
MSDRLKKYDIAILLDRSGSMVIEDCPNGKSRWDYARENVEAVAARANKLDSDGITVVVFGSKVKVYENTTPAKIQDIYDEVEPIGNTATDAALEALLTAEWFQGRKSGTRKPMIIIVFTDGKPSDQDALEKVIVNAANNIERDEDLGISFVQVGYDKATSEFLAYLDDNLTDKTKFDIVDTKTMEELEEIGVIGLFNAALDD